MGGGGGGRRRGAPAEKQLENEGEKISLPLPSFLSLSLFLDSSILNRASETKYFPSLLSVLFYSVEIHTGT